MVGSLTDFTTASGRWYGDLIGLRSSVRSRPVLHVPSSHDFVAAVVSSKIDVDLSTEASARRRLHKWYM